MCSGNFLRAVDDLACQRGGGDLVRDQADRVRAPLAERAREAVRAPAKLLNRRQNALAGLFGDVRVGAIVHDK